MLSKLQYFGFGLLALLLANAVHGADFDHQHQALTNLLQEVVVVNGHQSRVRYEQLIEKKSELDAYLTSLAGVTRAEFDAFSEAEQLAFLINTYNSQQLKQVIDHYPIKSIKDVGSFLSSPWSKEFFTLFGEPASLDLVEHGMIRTLFNEPRIHFAVNCASISCPPLMSEAFVGGKLDAQLEAATINFLKDSSANRLEGDTLYLSKIFDWYSGDFTGGVLSFVANYRPDWFADGEPDLSYTDYDWRLNKASN